MAGQRVLYLSGGAVYKVQGFFGWKESTELLRLDLRATSRGGTTPAWLQFLMGTLDPGSVVSQLRGVAGALETIFEQMKRAAAREYPTPMDVGSSAPSSKRPMRDFDDEEEPLSRRQKGESSVAAAPKSPKPGKAGKAAKDNGEKGEKTRGQNGMNWFVKEMGGRFGGS